MLTARRQAMPCIAAAYAIISVVMVLTGTIGARLHVAFPVLNRSSFGFWFSYFTVFSRVLLSMFWFGIQVMIMGVRFSNRSAHACI
jgi:NCS1 family nucleobase:cation symporter-1